MDLLAKTKVINEEIDDVINDYLKCDVTLEVLKETSPESFSIMVKALRLMDDFKEYNCEVAKRLDRINAIDKKLDEVLLILKEAK